MLKGIGGAMIFSGCLGLGIWYRERFAGRVRALYRLCGILELLASQVRYGRDALPECCRHAARQLPDPFGQAFWQVAERMRENTGASFAEVFRESTAPALESLPLTDEDREIFLEFASETGHTDGRMQLEILEQSRGRLWGTARRLEGESGEKGRMALGLGAMGGLLLVLILW